MSACQTTSAMRVPRQTANIRRSLCTVSLSNIPVMQDTKDLEGKPKYIRPAMRIAARSIAEFLDYGITDRKTLALVLALPRSALLS